MIGILVPIIKHSFLEPFAKAYEQYIRASRARGRANGQNGLKGRFFRAPEFYKRLFIYRF